jgi:rubredoxin
VADASRPLAQWVCQVCGFVYDEAAGLAEEGIAPGTRWEDIPDDWACPECGATKAEFEMVRVQDAA